MDIEFELFLGKFFLLNFAETVEELGAHPLGGFFVDGLRLLGERAVVDSDGVLVVGVDVLHGSGQARHVLEIAIGLSVVLGHRSAFDADSIALFETHSEVEDTLLGATWVGEAE